MPWYGRDPLPSARSDTFLRSLRLASCFLARAPAALLLYQRGIKPRRWLQRIPQIIAGNFTITPGPVRLRQPGYHDGTKMCLGSEPSRGPRRWSQSAGRLPRSLQKIPVSYAVPTRQHVQHMAQGLDHSQNGAVRVDSSERKSCSHACEPTLKLSRITPDGTSHLVQTGGFASYR